jgi:DMSO/TMAO reductase YedYZ molybdopterin-dependent catalytic subunit
MSGELKTITSPDTQRKNRVPPGQRLTDRFPVLQNGPIRNVDTAAWNFRIFGLVDREREFSFEEFKMLPQIKVFCDIHCVTTWSRLNNTFEGVPTAVLHELVKVKPEAKFVLVHAVAGWTTNLPIEDFFAEDALFALKFDGQDLTSAHGYPVRLVVPRLYFWKSAKWATGVEFIDEDRPGFWESVGYHSHGDPWTEERYG